MFTLRTDPRCLLLEHSYIPPKQQSLTLNSQTSFPRPQPTFIYTYGLSMNFSALCMVSHVHSIS